jgi:hypothetical protein
MPLLRLAVLPCCANVGSRSLLIPVCSGTSIVQHGMTRLSSLGSGYRCVTIAGRNTWASPSGVARRVPPRSGSLLICMPPPQWVNKHLLSPLIDDKQGEPEATPHLAMLVKRVAELYDTGLRACHYAEEFTL